MTNSAVLLKEMKELLDAYSGGRLPLNRLTQRLETLSNTLPNPSREWHTQFFRLWLGLEEVNALLLDSKRREPSIEEQHVLDDRLSKLSALIDSELAQLV